jgi:hypothetical protein
VIFWTIAGLVGSREKGLEHIMVEFHFWRMRDAVSWNRHHQGFG